MPIIRIQKWSGSNVKSSSFQIDLASGGIACCDGWYQSYTVAEEDAIAENKPESFQVPSGYRIHQYDSEWEHWIKTGNPDDFPAPTSSFCVTRTFDAFDRASVDFGALMPKLYGDWHTKFLITAIGTSNGDYNVLDGTNHDMAWNATSATTYKLGPAGNVPTASLTGPGGFVIPQHNVIDVDGERMHSGSITDSGIGSLAHGWGLPGQGLGAPPLQGPPYIGFEHDGHDYEANPNPPPAQIVHRVHAGVSVYYPPRWVNCWMASSRWVESYFPAPVGYSPKGAKCGTFMPMIIRFLIVNRKNKIVTISAGGK